MGLTMQEEAEPPSPDTAADAQHGDIYDLLERLTIKDEAKQIQAFDTVAVFLTFSAQYIAEHPKDDIAEMNFMTFCGTAIAVTSSVLDNQPLPEVSIRAQALRDQLQAVFASDNGFWVSHDRPDFRPEYSLRTELCSNQTQFSLKSLKTDDSIYQIKGLSHLDSLARVAVNYLDAGMGDAEDTLAFSGFCLETSEQILDLVGGDRPIEVINGACEVYSTLQGFLNRGQTTASNEAPGP